MKSLSILPPKNKLTLSIWTNTSVQLRLDWLEVGKKQEVFLCWQYFQCWSAAQSPSQHPKKEPHKSLNRQHNVKTEACTPRLQAIQPPWPIQLRQKLKNKSTSNSCMQWQSWHTKCLVNCKLQSPTKYFPTKIMMPPFFTIEYGRGHSDDL